MVVWTWEGGHRQPLFTGNDAFRLVEWYPTSSLLPCRSVVSSGAKAHDYFSSCAEGQKWDLDPAREGVPPLLYLLCVSIFHFELRWESGSRRKDTVDEGQREWAVLAIVLYVVGWELKKTNPENKTPKPRLITTFQLFWRRLWKANSIFNQGQ